MKQHLSLPAIIKFSNGKLSAFKWRLSKIKPRHAKDIFKDLYIKALNLNNDDSL